MVAGLCVYPLPADCALPEGRVSLDSSWFRGWVAVNVIEVSAGERTQGLATSGKSEVWKLTQPGRPNPEDSVVTDWLGRVRREEESHTDGSEVWSWGQPVPPLIDSARRDADSLGRPHPLGVRA